MTAASGDACFLDYLAASAVVTGMCVLAGGLHADEPARSSATGEPFSVRAHRDITYVTIPRDPDRSRHQLDVYCPRSESRFPVLMFVHGGAWVTSGKDDVLGIFGYGTIARCLARRGLVVVVPNYRLSPGVKHPEHIKDVARAFDWTCKNIAEYGGDPERIFVAGHSAGGHLVSLLAMDPTYLKEVGRSDKDIQGVIGLSGVYRLEDFNADLKMSLAISGKSIECGTRVRPLSAVFGTGADALREASPISHVRPGLPPFLLLNGGLDYRPLRSMVKDFAAALKEKGCDVQCRELVFRTHETLVFDIPHLTAEPKMVDAIVEFIGQGRQRAALP